MTIRLGKRYFKSKETVWMFLTVFVVLINMFGSKNTAIVSTASIIEYAICIVIMLLGRPSLAYTLFIFFLSNCLEVQYFVTGIREMDGSFYSFAYLPLIGRHGMLIFSALIYLITFANKQYSNIYTSSNKNLVFLHKANHYILVCGVLFFGLLYVLNDNAIRDVPWYWSDALKHIERSIILFFTAESGMLLLVNNEKTYGMLSNMMKGAILSLPIAGFIGVGFGLTGSRGFVGGLSLLPLYSSFGVYLLLFIKYENDVLNKTIIVILTTLLTLYLILFPTQLGGKFVLSIIITAYYMFYSRGKKYAAVTTIIAGIALLVVFESGLLEMIFQNNSYMLTKIIEAKSVTSFFGGRSVAANENVGFRFDEFANVFQEYLNKPYYMIFGKGIGGTILHHTNTYSWSDAGSFTSQQISSGLFMELHETVNVVFLSYGIVGLIGLGRLVIKLLKSVRFSKWAIIGVTWLVFYFGIYYSMYYGLVAMILAIYESTGNENNELGYA